MEDTALIMMKGNVVSNGINQNPAPSDIVQRLFCDIPARDTQFETNHEEH